MQDATGVQCCDGACLIVFIRWRQPHKNGRLTSIVYSCGTQRWTLSKTHWTWNI